MTQTEIERFARMIKHGDAWLCDGKNVDYLCIATGDLFSITHADKMAICCRLRGLF